MKAALPSCLPTVNGISGRLQHDGNDGVRRLSDKPLKEGAILAPFAVGRGIPSGCGSALLFSLQLFVQASEHPLGDQHYALPVSYTHLTLPTNI